ncbi:TPA: hypothetical protein N0F65_003406 [Lagenidium giganteum]|uniref:folate gamma-glutamyl hydrolase n=1 Tax=Lagenidium giganteum TaxID=4803 RepID=A0AAV2YUB1_9STRA|nr:TPA: hypothetical protein N0F65_003406 [Lagenidium giganteum]
MTDVAPHLLLRNPSLAVCEAEMKWLSAIVFAVWCSAAAWASTGPVIGVSVQPIDDGTKAYLNTTTGDNLLYTYVSWVESAGGRVVPIPYNAPIEQLDELLPQLNGILFTGGDASVNDKAVHIYQRAVEMNDRGIRFPVWGICLGFEWLVQITARDLGAVQSGFATENISLPLDFTAEAASSRMFGGASADLMDALATRPLTFNLHHDGITVDHFNSFPKLTDFYKVLSTNEDTQGRRFVSAIEAKDYPFYGIQFHPEKMQFEFGEYPNGAPYRAVDHSKHAVLAAQHLANVFIQEARKNDQRFASAAARRKALIYNYRTTTTPNPSLPVLYVFLDFPHADDNATPW